MSNYDTLINTLNSNVYQNSNNAITGGILKSVLTSFISTLGLGSGYMGVLSSANRPTSNVDGKQFYIGYNASNTTMNIDLTSVGLGTLSITRNNIYVVHNNGGTWLAVDIAAGLSAAIPTSVNDMSGINEYEKLPDYDDNYTGNVELVVAQNTVYVIENCTSFTVIGYDYTQDTKSIAQPPSYIFVMSDVEIYVDLSQISARLRDGDTLHLTPGELYLITVRGILWSIEKYV